MRNIKVVSNNIADLKVEAIVCPANPSLSGKGGVQGAVHKAAGPEFRADVRKLGGCKTSEVKMTDGYNLPAQYVIHTVGPKYNTNHPTQSLTALTKCYENIFALAKTYDLDQIAIPCISTGAYGFPVTKAAFIAMWAAIKNAEENPNLEVIFCTYADHPNYNTTYDAYTILQFAFEFVDKVCEGQEVREGFKLGMVQNFYCEYLSDIDSFWELYSSVDDYDFENLLPIFIEDYQKRIGSDINNMVK
jgi:O-acetyl-ADP-ribose deacetylase (regulator of RNase III)